MLFSATAGPIASLLRETSNNHLRRDAVYEFVVRGSRSVNGNTAAGYSSEVHPLLRLVLSTSPHRLLGNFSEGVVEEGIFERCAGRLLLLLFLHSSRDWR